MKKIKIKKIIISSLCVVLCGVILTLSIIYLTPNPKDAFKYLDKDISVSQNSTASFQSDIKTPTNNEAVQNKFSSVMLDSSGEYTIYYRSELPEFFVNLNIGDLFCVFPDETAKESIFIMGFCGEITEISENELYVSFTIPPVYKIFSKLRIDTSEANITSVSFLPEEAYTSVQCVPLSVGNQNSLNASSAMALGNSTVSYQYKENTKEPLIDEYNILFEKLKISINYKSSEDFSLKGSVTLENPSVNLLLDYDYDESNDTVNINDYAFDFISKQKFDLKFSGKNDLLELKSAKDIPETISPVNVVDVTESETGKIVLGTFLLGYQLKLPAGFNNNSNKVGYLSFGIAFQLAITASGSITLNYNYEQKSYLEVHANPNKNSAIVKNYSYPHPVVDATLPTANIEQESIEYDTSYSGSLDFHAGVSVDVGLCLLGMIPLKICNGIEGEISSTFDTNEKTVKLVENGYVSSTNVDSYYIDLYSQLKIYLGAKIKGTKNLSANIRFEKQLARLELIRMPKVRDFCIEECYFAGIKLGQCYTDEEMTNALESYAKKNKNYTYFDYYKDTAVDSVLQDIWSDFPELIREITNDIDFEIDYDNAKVDYYPSGAIFIRNNQNKVISILLTGKKISNEAGLNGSSKTEDIKKLYGAPDEDLLFESNFSWIIQSLLSLKENKSNFRILSYNGKKSENLKMGIVAVDGASKLIVITGE